MSLRRFLLANVVPSCRQRATASIFQRYPSSSNSSQSQHAAATQRQSPIRPSERLLSTSTTTSPSGNNDDAAPTNEPPEQDNGSTSSARRVWRHVEKDATKTKQPRGDGLPSFVSSSSAYWTSRIDQQVKLEDLIHSIQVQQERTGGRMRQFQLGVLHTDPAMELRHLVDNYTVTAIASALRDREDALQYAATLSDENRHAQLAEFLRQYHPRYILERRSSDNTTTMDPVLHLNQESARQVLRKSLMRMPRTVSTSFTKRAGVCLALAWTNDTAVIVLEKRAENLRAHPDQVCLPGGMVCDIRDETIVSTSIREMKEEIRGLEDCAVEVLGILRLNWGEVHHLTGVAVTPVVCYLGELPDSLSPSPNEVSEIFTIPLKDLVANDNWVHKEGLAPIFVGGPHVIWGLTGYILERFRKDILRPLRREFKNESNTDG